MSSDFYNTDNDILTAASSGDLGFVRRLLMSGANIERTNENGWTPLMLAAHYGHYNVVKMLLDNGAKVEAQEWQHGRTALMLASSSGHTRCIEVLVNQGKCSIDQRDRTGKAAAYYAIHSGHGRNKIIAKLLKIQPKSRPISRPIKGRYDSRNAANHTRSNTIQKTDYMSKGNTTTSPKGGKPTVNNKAEPWSDNAGATQELPVIKIDEYQSSPNLPDFAPYLHFPSPYATPTSDGFIPGSSVTGNCKSEKRSFDGCELDLPSKRPVGDGSSRRSSSSSSTSADLQRQLKQPIMADGTPSFEAELEKLKANVASAAADRAAKLPNDLKSLLEQIEMAEYFEMFERHKVDLDAFMTLEDADLERLGVPFGHRRRMWLAQTRFRESVDVGNTQERLLANWLLYERESLRNENQELRLKIKQMEAMCDTVISLRAQVVEQ